MSQGPVGGTLAPEINAAASRYGVPASLVKAVATQESSLGTDPSSNGNIMQVNSGATGISSINEGTQMLSQYWNQTGHNTGWTLAMYNMGPNIYSWAKSRGINDPVDAMSQFSTYMREHGYASGYGDPSYIQHVTRYLK